MANLEVAELFRRFGAAYRQKYGARMLPSHVRAMQAIQDCRTEALGGHVYACAACETTQYSYHSCKNRHCPKCQNDAAQAWLDEQHALLLPVPYFLLTFTLPEQLRDVARSHQRLIYTRLFRSAAAAMQQLARDPRHLGAQIGMVGVLHTWTRDLRYHPHVHFLVPAGGLSLADQRWLSTRDDFFLPVKALSILFRAKFRDGLADHTCFDAIPADTWTQDWVVHCKPVGNGRAALKYLAPYVFRVALSNKRLVKLVDERITFRYTSSQTGQTCYCTLPVEEFIRRFLQHVLPKGFVKVRYYGFFAHGQRRALEHARQSLGATTSATPTTTQNSACTPETTLRCPQCGQPMRVVQVLRPRGRCPP